MAPAGVFNHIHVSTYTMLNQIISKLQSASKTI